jgi:D-alanine-D-alanine ligase
MARKLKITVMLGGPSAEREVSLRSGTAVAQALRSLGHCVEQLDPIDATWTLSPGTDVVFLALHGTYGEDGEVQKRLDECGIVYTGCNAEASKIAFDKALTKQRCMDLGVPTAPYLVFRSADAKWPANWNPPVVLKPVRQGSSVGLSFVNSVEEFSPALAHSLRYDSEVMMEPKIEGRETTVGILDGRALPVVEVRPKTGAYDYQNKYTKGATEYFCPADFAPETTLNIQNAALGAFKAIGGRDYARIDVMVRQDGSPVVLEVNTLPGMTETSLLPKAAMASGMNYAGLCQKMIDLALSRSGKIE